MSRLDKFILIYLIAIGLSLLFGAVVLIVGVR